MTRYPVPAKRNSYKSLGINAGLLSHLNVVGRVVLAMIRTGAVRAGRPVHSLTIIMKFLRLAQAFTATAAIAAAPAMAQVSSDLLGNSTGTGVLGAGLGALRNGGSAITTYVDPSDPSKGISSQTTGTASGGKVGTFTFSGSEGTSQNFSVGTSTNLGVNASASSTSEYAVTSTAALAVGGSSLRQTIGTSGIQDSASSREQLKSSYVEDTVSRTVGSSSTDYFTKASEDSKTLTSSQMTQKYNWWNDSMSGKTSSEIETAAASTSGKTSTQLFEDAKLKTSQQAASDYSTSAASSQAANGVISGSFKAASTSTGDTIGTTASNSTDNNEVTVKGIGNAATLNANGGSEFRTNVVARTGSPTSNSATANGGAGASMSSTSTANASNTGFSSVFIQSF
jgi:hypothetical protein